MANNSTKFIEDFAFYEQLWFYYTTNRGRGQELGMENLFQVGGHSF